MGSGTVMGFAPLFSKFNPLKKQAVLAFSMGEMPCFSCRQWLPGQRVASRNTDITQDAAFHGPLETKESISLIELIRFSRKTSILTLSGLLPDIDQLCV